MDLRLEDEARGLTTLAPSGGEGGAHCEAMGG